MSESISITGFSSTENVEYKKHLKAVVFCIENELSFPKETSEFFKGKVGGEDLEDIKEDCILGYIENGLEVPLNIQSDNCCVKRIRVSDIPPEVTEIIVELS